jgi:hypothetical protein
MLLSTHVPLNIYFSCFFFHTINNFPILPSDNIYSLTIPHHVNSQTEKVELNTEVQSQDEVYTQGQTEIQVQIQVKVKTETKTNTLEIDDECYAQAEIEG